MYDILCIDEDSWEVIEATVTMCEEKYAKVLIEQQDKL